MSMISSKYHSHVFHHYLPSNVSKLMITHMLRDFSLMFISVFFPIFLLIKGFALYEAILFEAFVFSLHALFTCFSYKLHARYGIKLVMSLSFVFTILSFSLLFFIDPLLQEYNSLLVLAVIAFTSALGDAMYWHGFHLDFALKSRPKHEGRELGILEATTILLRMTSPLVGAFLATYFSFELVFLVATFFLVIAVLPLLVSENITFSRTISAKRALSFSHLKWNLLFLLEGFNHIAQAFIWPLLLYIINFTLIIIGSLVSLATLLSAFITYASGNLSDRYGTKKVFRTGALSNGITLFLRAFFDSTSGVFIFQTLGGLSAPLFSLPFITTVYRKAKHEAVEILMTRDTYLNIGRVFFFLLTIASIFLLGEVLGLVIMLIIGGIVTIFCGFLSKYFENKI